MTLSLSFTTLLHLDLFLSFLSLIPMIEVQFIAHNESNATLLFITAGPDS